MLRSPPRPSRLYPTFWRFAIERQEIYMRRVAGAPPPWTNDSTLTMYKFTNVYRAADRVSQYLLKMIYSEPSCDPDTILLRVLLFKIFNKIETWEQITLDQGLPEASRFDFARCACLLTRLRGAGRSIYTGAYIMPSNGIRGALKHEGHLQLLRTMLRDRLAYRIAEAPALADVYGLLRSYPSLGPFLAFQYAIDLNYSSLTDHSEMDFVVAGPGALDGLAKCFESFGDFTAEDVIRWVTDRQEEEFKKQGLVFQDLWGRRLHCIDVQNIFCEISKYTRVTDPDVKGTTDRTRIKKKFVATGPIPEPFFPPKWGLASKVRSWLETHASPAVQPPAAATQQGSFAWTNPERGISTSG